VRIQAIHKQNSQIQHLHLCSNPDSISGDYFEMHYKLHILVT
jgi:hypothetical protein